MAVLIGCVNWTATRGGDVRYTENFADDVIYLDDPYHLGMMILLSCLAVPCLGPAWLAFKRPILEPIPISLGVFQLHSASFLFQILQDDRSCSVLQLNRPIMISQAKYSLCDIQSSRLISGRNYSSDHPTSVISVKFHACIICTLAIRTLLWPILFPVSSCL